jgi:Mn-dependent DtxR family transcriptional regulator
VNRPDWYDPTRPAPVLEARCAKIVEYLRRNGPARRGVAARALDIHPSTLANRIVQWRLAEHGVVTTKRRCTGCEL